MTPEQKCRYSRNTLMPEIGAEGQLRLLNSHVLVVGAGALGSIASMYMAASGTGHITILDFDTIDVSNLQRQLSFTTGQCGMKKVEALAMRLAEINPDISITPVETLLTTDNAASLIEGQDLVIEGSDNPATKYIVSDTCRQLGIPCVLGGVAQWQGQVMSWAPGYPCYRDIFPEAAGAGGFTPCSIGGVLGPLPGITGSAQAAEAIKILTGAGHPLYGRMLLFDTLDAYSRILDL